MTWTSRIVLILAFSASFAAEAKIKLPAIFNDDMVVQRDRPVFVWGWADPGETVTATFTGNQAEATADPNGKWTLSLPAVKAGGPYEMTVKGEDGSARTMKNVLVGEVWLCSGQSNMNWPMKDCSTAGDMKTANDKELRLFVVPNQIAHLPCDEIPGVHRPRWTEANAKTLNRFSAVAYYFGRELREKLDVPVGLIQCSWSGTKIDAWTPLEGIAAVTALKKIEKAVDTHRKRYLRDLPGHIAAVRAWAERSEKAMANGEHPQPIPANPTLLHQNAHPTSIFNAMVNPLVPFPIRGAIWYQGESNAADGALYFEKMKALINGWRKAWRQNELPFYFVQIPPCVAFYGKTISLPQLWEAQTTSLTIPDTGMAVISDAVNVKALHPRDKKPVGERLARLALSDTYDLDVGESHSPLFKSAEFADGAVRVEFTHAEGGLTTRDGKPPTHFEIAGPNGKFVPAQAKIDGAAVVVSNDNVQTPEQVRFAWRNNAQPNLMNKSGLPAAAFRVSKEQ